LHNNKKQINLSVDDIISDEYNHVDNIINYNLKNDRIIVFVLKKYDVLSIHL
jgi:hypothetical protein